MCTIITYPRNSSKARPSQSSKAPSAYLKNLYFDTLVYDVDTLEHLKAKVGGDKLMLGTDYPYTLGDWLGGENIHALKCFGNRKRRDWKPTLGGC